MGRPRRAPLQPAPPKAKRTARRRPEAKKQGESSILELKSAIAEEIERCLRELRAGDDDCGGSSESCSSTPPSPNEPPEFGETIFRAPNPFKLPPLPSQGSPAARWLVAMKHEPKARFRRRSQHCCEVPRPCTPKGVEQAAECEAPDRGQERGRSSIGSFPDGPKGLAETVRQLDTTARRPVPGANRVVAEIQGLNAASTDRFMYERYGDGGPGEDTIFGKTLAAELREHARRARERQEAAEIAEAGKRPSLFESKFRGLAIRPHRARRRSSVRRLSALPTPPVAPTGLKSTTAAISAIGALQSSVPAPPAIKLPTLQVFAKPVVAEPDGEKPRVLSPRVATASLQVAAKLKVRRKSGRQPSDVLEMETKVKDSISAADFERFKRAFDELDDDGSGEITLQEMRSHGGVIHLAGKVLDQRIFNQIDRDHNGTVDFMELMRAWFPLVPKAQLEAHMEVHREADRRRHSLLLRQRPLEERFTAEQLDELRCMFNGFVKRSPSQHRTFFNSPKTLDLDTLQQALPSLSTAHLSEYLERFGDGGTMKFEGFCDMMKEAECV